MSIASWIENLSTQFWLSLLFGILVTFLFCFKSFGESTIDVDPDKFETTLAPSELTRSQEYTFSFLIYSLVLVIFYVVVCLIGPAPFKEVTALDASITATADSFPIWVALVLTGFLPRVPVLSGIERNWRKLMHQRAQIPRAVEALSIDFRRANFRFTAFRPLVDAGQGVYARNVAPSDIDADSDSASHRWARLSAIFQQISTLETNPTFGTYANVSFLDRHRMYFLALQGEYSKLATSVNQRRGLFDDPNLLVVTNGTNAGVTGTIGQISTQSTRDAGDVDPEFRPEIERLLRNCCMFLACTLVGSANTPSSRRDIMHVFDFDDPDIVPMSVETDIVIKALCPAVLTYVVFVFVASKLDTLVPEQFFETGWPSDAHRGDRLQRILFFFIPHLAALCAALTYRHALHSKGNWLRGDEATRKLAPASRYAALCILAYVFGMLGTGVIAGWFQNIESLMSSAYWSALDGLSPVTTALFVAVALDANSVRRSVAAQVITGLTYTCVSGILSFVGADHFYTTTVVGQQFTGAKAFSVTGMSLFAATLALAMTLLTLSSVGRSRK